MDGCCVNCGEEGNWCRCDEEETPCRFPGMCVMGASPHMPQECVHLDDAAHYYEMLESEFTSTEEIGGEA